MTTLHEHLDDATLRELAAVLGDDFPVLVSTFLADSETRLAAMRLASALADAPALREAAHSLKGSSLNVGAVRLAALCREVEAQVLAGTADTAALLAEIAGELRLVTVLLGERRP